MVPSKNSDWATFFFFFFKQPLFILTCHFVLTRFCCGFVKSCHRKKVFFSRSGSLILVLRKRKLNACFYFLKKKKRGAFEKITIKFKISAIEMNIYFMAINTLKINIVQQHFAKSRTIFLFNTHRKKSPLHLNC